MSARVLPKTSTARPHVKGGFIPLGSAGSDGLTSVVWSNARNSVVHINPAELTARYLQTIVSLPWAAEHYSIKDERDNKRIAWENLASDLIHKCSLAGRFDCARMLGRGFWNIRTEHGPELVFNTGSELLSLSGRPVSRISSAGVFVESSSCGIDQNSSAATVEELVEILEMLKSWGYRNDDDAYLSLGWLAIAPFAGALSRRPMLQLTGARACGKSTLLDAIARLLAGSCLKVDGGSTPAGVRQRLGHDACVIIIDEFGDDRTSKKGIAKTKEFVLMAREWYSSDTGEGTLRGTQGGDARAYSGRAVGLFAGIHPPEMEASDATRFVRIHLRRLPAGAHVPPLLFDEERLESLGRGLRVRMFKSYPALTAAIACFKATLLGRVREPRTADNLATLLAGAFVALNGRAPEPDEVMKTLGDIDLSAHIQAMDGAADDRDCIDWLLGAMLRTEHGERPVGELIAQVLAGNKSHVMALADAGIRVREDGSLAVCTAKTLAGLRTLFAGSKFADGGWKVILERAPGVQTCRAKFAGRAYDAVALPMAWVLDEPSGAPD